MLNTTSSTVIGVPSWKSTPSRIVNVYVSPSSLTVQSDARFGHSCGVVLAEHQQRLGDARGRESGHEVVVERRIHRGRLTCHGSHDRSSHRDCGPLPADRVVGAASRDGQPQGQRRAPAGGHATHASSSFVARAPGRLPRIHGRPRPWLDGPSRVPTRSSSTNPHGPAPILRQAGGGVEFQGAGASVSDHRERRPAPLGRVRGPDVIDGARPRARMRNTVAPRVTTQERCRTVGRISGPSIALARVAA